MYQYRLLQPIERETGLVAELTFREPDLACIQLGSPVTKTETSLKQNKVTQTVTTFDPVVAMNWLYHMIEGDKAILSELSAPDLWQLFGMIQGLLPIDIKTARDWIGLLKFAHGFSVQELDRMTINDMFFWLQLNLDYRKKFIK